MPFDAPDREQLEAGGVEDENQRGIVCAECRERLTSRTASIVVNRHHEHRFMNPGGRIFVMRCFSDAPRVHAMYAPTADYSWFAGFLWRYAHCGNCAFHLGWLFLPLPTEPAPSFLALITSCIVDEGR